MNLDDLFSLANKVRLCELEAERIGLGFSAKALKREADALFNKLKGDSFRIKAYTLTKEEENDRTGAGVLLLRQSIRDRFLSHRGEGGEYDGVDVYSSDNVDLLFRVL